MLCFVGSIYALTATAIDWPDRNVADWSKEQKLAAANMAGALLITGWGIANWNYFQTRPHAQTEGWFGENTKSGGADKLGHFYSNYCLSHGLSSLYEDWGYSYDLASVYGAWSSFGMMGLMELGDAFSDYGFSYEDMVMNAIGSYTGYLMRTTPELKRKIDFRMEYSFKFEEQDIFTDYENTKYLVALKFDGFDHLQTGPLRYLEFQFGYYTRNYSDSNHEKRERNIYVGLGLNLSRVFADLSFRKMSRVFNYLQLPGTYIDVNKDLND
jgi:hypothetical protein